MASKKCALIIDGYPKNLDSEACQTKQIRSFVGCLASYKRKNEGKDFGDAMREAWADVKKACAEYR